MDSPTFAKYGVRKGTKRGGKTPKAPARSTAPRRQASDVPF
jgi:hypothetical protein